MANKETTRQPAAALKAGHADRSPGGRTAAIILVIVPVVVVAFTLGRRSAPGATEEPPPGSGGARQAAAVRPAAHASKALTLPPAFLPSTGQPDPVEEHRARQERATHLFTSFLDKLSHADLFPEGMSPEMRASSVREYMKGVVATVRAVDPSIKGPLAEEFTRLLCGSQPLAEDKVIELAYFGQEMPEATTLAAFDCFFNRVAGKEDVSLWYMLDAWKRSGYAKPASLALVQQRATDRRTLDRLSERRPEAIQHRHERR